MRSITPHVTRAPRVTHSHACVIAARRARARHRQFHSPRSHARARFGGGSRSIARSRARCVALAVEAAVSYIARHARQTLHARRSTRARTRTSSPLRARHHRFPFPPPRTTGTRALLRRRRRSLDRPIARTRCGAGDGGGGRLHRVSRLSRARAHTSSQRIARVITAPLV